MPPAERGGDAQPEPEPAQEPAVYDTVIPRNVRVSEAPSHGLPVILYDIKCAGAEAYAKLAGEMLRREARGFSASLAS